MTENAAVNSLSWSPDGQRIAYSSLPLDQASYVIFIADVESFGIGRLEFDLAGGAHRDEVAWSPSGDRLAFVQRVADDGRIHIMNADGTNIEFLTEGNYPNWSPDSKSIVFIERREDYGLFGNVAVIGVDGMNSHLLTSDMLAEWPNWSPDGKRIAFYGSRSDGKDSGIYMMNSDGSGLQLVYNGAESPPSWSRDGEFLLFTEQGLVYAIDSASFYITPVTGLPSNLYYTFVLQQPN